MTADLDALLREGTGQGALADGKAVSVLEENALRRVTRQAGVSLREAQARALDLSIVPTRYLRNRRFYSCSEQARLLRSRVSMAGLGGLGGYVLEILARSGVGCITAADGEWFEESNLNRQLLCTTAALDRSKARAASLRAAEINPAVETDFREAVLDEEGFAELVRGTDVALDCLGGLDDRPLLARAAGRVGVPLVSAAVAGTTGWVAVCRPGDPLPVKEGGAGAEDSLGTQAPAVAFAASLQAGHALDLLVGKGSSLEGKRLLFDIRELFFQTVVL